MLTPTDQSNCAATAAPLTRRQMREAEQEGRRHSARRVRRTSRKRRVQARAAARPTTAPVVGKPQATKASSAASRSRSIASKGLTLLTMAFVATVTVATSVPANALFTASDLTSAPAQASTSTQSLPAQTLTVADGQMEAVTRESYTVESYQEVELAQANAGVGTFSNNPNGVIQWPFVVAVPISGTFGYRNAPCGGCSSNHKGVDFAPGAGAPIQSIADGVVRYAKESDYGLGVHAIVDHMIDGRLVTSVYGHMQFGSLQVTQGQVIKVGDQIGAVGNTGASTGAHLHLEIQLEDGTQIDPYAWLKAHAN